MSENAYAQVPHQHTSRWTSQKHNATAAHRTGGAGTVNTHTHPFNGPFSGTTQVSRYQKGRTNQDFTEARDSEWQWHQLGQMQVCTLLQTDNHTSIPPLNFLQAGCPSCRPTNSVKALIHTVNILLHNIHTSELCADNNTNKPGT